MVARDFHQCTHCPDHIMLLRTYRMYARHPLRSRICGKIYGFFFLFEICIEAITLLWPSKNCKVSRIGASYLYYCRFENVWKIITPSTQLEKMSVGRTVLFEINQCDLREKIHPVQQYYLYDQVIMYETQGLAYGSCYGRIIAKSPLTQAKRINSFCSVFFFFFPLESCCSLYGADLLCSLTRLPRP